MTITEDPAKEKEYFFFRGSLLPLANASGVKRLNQLGIWTEEPNSINRKGSPTTYSCTKIRKSYFPELLFKNTKHKWVLFQQNLDK
jgi:hypothetical protein